MTPRCEGGRAIANPSAQEVVGTEPEQYPKDMCTGLIWSRLSLVLLAMESTLCLNLRLSQRRLGRTAVALAETSGCEEIIQLLRDSLAEKPVSN
jgi:hypothetical protein